MAESFEDIPMRPGQLYRKGADMPEIITSTEIITVDLADLAARIRMEHEAAAASRRQGIGHALTAGELLLEAKAKVHHGEWLPWLRHYCGVSERSARRYMQLASHRAEIEAKTATVADLTINWALEVLRPQVPELQFHPFNEIFPVDEPVHERACARLVRFRVTEPCR